MFLAATRLLKFKVRTILNHSQLRLTPLGGANEVSYAIIDGQIADVSFTLNEKSFTVRASAQEGDFSGLSGKVTSSETIDANTNAVLTKVQTDINTYYKIVWTNGKINYCLFGTDGAEKQQVIAVYEAIKNSFKLTSKMSEKIFQVFPTFLFFRSLYMNANKKSCAQADFCCGESFNTRTKNL